MPSDAEAVERPAPAEMQNDPGGDRRRGDRPEIQPAEQDRVALAALAAAGTSGGSRRWSLASPPTGRRRAARAVRRSEARLKPSGVAAVSADHRSVRPEQRAARPEALGQPAAGHLQQRVGPGEAGQDPDISTSVKPNSCWMVGAATAIAVRSSDMTKVIGASMKNMIDHRRPRVVVATSGPPMLLSIIAKAGEGEV